MIGRSISPVPQRAFNPLRCMQGVDLGYDLPFDRLDRQRPIVPAIPRRFQAIPLHPHVPLRHQHRRRRVGHSTPHQPTLQSDHSLSDGPIGLEGVGTENDIAGLDGEEGEEEGREEGGEGGGSDGSRRGWGVGGFQCVGGEGFDEEDLSTEGERGQH